MCGWDVEGHEAVRARVHITALHASHGPWPCRMRQAPMPEHVHENSSCVYLVMMFEYTITFIAAGTTMRKD